jgi:hypothetical protein
VGVSVGEFAKFSRANADNFYIEMKGLAGELVISIEHRFFVIHMTNY